MQNNEPDETSPSGDDFEITSYSDSPAKRFARVAELFEKARELPQPEKLAFLQQACGSDSAMLEEVQELLQADAQEGGALQEGDSAFETSWALDVLADAASIPERIGPYEVQEELGAGGMGRVYLGRRSGADFDKPVAIKVLRPGLDDSGLLTRFRSERQILAQLNHPYIAALLDGGATEQGQPYLVMEYVAGRGLLEHAAARSLRLKERLELFSKICEAVAVLHQNLIVHRDLKPSNIMVTEDGTPKILDFGIAKILQSNPSGMSVAKTSTGMMLYTPEYASPEQALGEAITTASDVYSLGVLLYELLSGERPYQFKTRTPVEVAQVLGEQQPPLMSAVAGREARHLSGDLDTIVAMALRKEPERRYASVAMFREDVQRYLKGLTVRAQKDTVGYRTRKFIRRRFGWVAAAALFLIMLSGFAVSMYVQVGRTAKQRDLANVRAQTFGEVSQFLVDLFRVSAPDESAGEQISAKSLLDKGANQIRYEVQSDPRVRAALLVAMGRAYHALGNIREGGELLEQGVGLLASDASDPDSLAKAQVLLGSVRFDQGEVEEAERLMREAMRSQLELGADNQQSLQHTRVALSNILRERGSFEEALELITLAREELELTKGETPRPWIGARVVEARQYEAQGDFAKAEAIQKSVLEELDKLFEGDHPDKSKVWVDLSTNYNSQGRLKDGIEAVREALRMDINVLGEDHPTVDYHLFNLAALLKESGDLTGALSEYEKLLVRDRERYGEHNYVALDIANMAGIHMALGDMEKAEGMYREALRIQLKVLPPDHPELATTQSNIGSLFQKKRDPDAAIPFLEEALRIRTKVFPADHPALLTSRNMMAVAYHAQGRLEEAMVLTQQVLKARRAKLGEHRHVAGSLFSLGHLYKTMERFEEAEMTLRESAAMFRKVLPEGHLDSAGPIYLLGRMLHELGRGDEARQLLESAVSIFKQHLPADHPKLVNALELLKD